MNITKDYYDNILGNNHNIYNYNFKYEKFSSMHKCNRLLIKINEVKNNNPLISINILTNNIKKNIDQLSLISKKSSSFNNSHYKISNASVNIKKSLMEIESEFEELKSKHLNNKDLSINKYSKLLLENSLDIINNNISDLTLKFQKLLKEQAEKITKIEKRKKFISSSNRKNNINNTFNEYATDFTNNNFNEEEDVLLEVGDKQTYKNRESEYYKSRLNEVQSIEKTMSEISGIMNRLSQMTYEHSFMIDNISKNTDIALENVEKGEKEIKKALERAKSNKWLFIKIFFIIICISIFYIIFIG